MNTFFKHRESHKSMIDLVLAGQKRLIADVKAVPSVSMDSDQG